VVDGLSHFDGLTALIQVVRLPLSTRPRRRCVKAMADVALK